MLAATDSIAACAGIEAIQSNTYSIVSFLFAA
jgi:hypothetical protein